MQLNVYDMDGTIVDSTAAIRRCQIEGMYRATGKNISQLEQLLREKGLKRALSELGIEQDTFFKVHYKTFDPFEAAKNGQMSVFKDAYVDLAMANYISKSGVCLISNSTRDATFKKLDAAGLNWMFNYVLAEVEKEKAKPTPYMAMQLRDKLIDDGNIKFVSSLLNYGDQPVDMEFGEVLHDVLSGAKGRDIPYKNYFIDRNNSFGGILPKSAIVVPSFEYTVMSKLLYSGAE